MSSSRKDEPFPHPFPPEAPSKKRQSSFPQHVFERSSSGDLNKISGANHKNRHQQTGKQRPLRIQTAEKPFPSRQRACSGKQSAAPLDEKKNRAPKQIARYVNRRKEKNRQSFSHCKIFPQGDKTKKRGQSPVYEKMFCKKPVANKTASRPLFF